MEEELQRLESENKELGKKTREHTRKMEALESDKEQLKSKHQRVTSIGVVDTKMLADLEDKIISLESEKAALEKKLRDTSKRNEDLEAEKESLNQQLKQEKQRSNDKIDKLKNKVSALNETVRQL